MILLSKEQPSEREEKVKEFMEKLRNCIDLKKIFDKYSMICIFCLENFKSDTDTDIEELKKDEKKKEYEKEEISKLDCGHKFHKNVSIYGKRKMENAHYAK